MRSLVAFICCAMLVCQVHGRPSLGESSLQRRSLLATPVPAGTSCSTTDTCVDGAQCVGATDSASGTCTASATQAKVQSSTEKRVPAVTSVATLVSFSTPDAFSDTEREKFILTLQTNIRAKINAIVDVNIDKVTSGSESILVRNTATFTDANSDTAKAGQSALEQVYKSRSVADIFGTQYGAVTVTDISTDYAANPTLSTSGAARASAATWALVAILVAAAVL